MAAWSFLREIEKERGNMTAKRLAEILGCSPKHVYDLHKRGILPTVEGVGNKKLFDPATVVYVYSKMNKLSKDALRAAA